jgi:RNA-directed DNA polymerase
MLANIYLHYAFDLWWTSGAGSMRKAMSMSSAMRTTSTWASSMGLTQTVFERASESGWVSSGFHPEKTRRIEFGRFAQQNRKRREEGKPETFDFLGFPHISGKNRNGSFMVRRMTIASS